MDKFYVGLKLSVEEDPERVMRGRVLREEYLKEFGKLKESFTSKSCNGIFYSVIALYGKFIHI